MPKNVQFHPPKQISGYATVLQFFLRSFRIYILKQWFSSWKWSGQPKIMPANPIHFKTFLFLVFLDHFWIVFNSPIWLLSWYKCWWSWSFINLTYFLCVIRVLNISNLFGYPTKKELHGQLKKRSRAAPKGAYWFIKKSALAHQSILANFDFFIFPIFTFKFGHFKIQTIFSHATNTQA